MVDVKMKKSDSSSEEETTVDQQSDWDAPLVDEGLDEGNCGYGSCEPGFLRCCNNAKGFLVMYCLSVVVQGMLVNGFVNVSISTLEKRFGFTSTETGVMSVGYDIAFCCVTMFLTYFAARAHRPRLVGIGIFILGVGAMIFCLPHFTTPLYKISDRFGEICSDGSTDCETVESEGYLRGYIYVFILAQLLHGIGCTPLFTLGLSYLEDSVPKEKASIYLGIGNSASVLGPVIGYALGGVVLSFYVDFDVSNAKVEINPQDPRWVGAWWLGMIISMTCAFLLCVPYFGFPKAVPGTTRFRAMRESEVPRDGGEETARKKNFGKSFKDFPAALLTLFKNSTYVFASLATCSEAMVVSGFTTWLPKIVQNEFQQPAGTAAILAGVIGIPGGMVGHLLSGFLVSRFRMKAATIYKLNVVYCLIVFALTPILLIYCPNKPVAGITTPYSENSVLGRNLISACNSNCTCQEEYFIPVCGADNITYFTACHAGCERSDVISNTTYFYNCTCVDGINPEDWQAKSGSCYTSCENLSLYLGIFFLVVLFNFMSSTPAMVATFRIVPPNMRSFAVGTQWLFLRVFGSIPGPILFGVIIDLTCLLWQTRQCDAGSSGSCWIYDSTNMAVNVIAIAMTCKLLSAILYFCAYWFYKPPIRRVDEDELKATSSNIPEESDCDQNSNHSGNKSGSSPSDDLASIL